MKIMCVSPTGDDISGNGSFESPYKTIEYALSLFTDGDQIRLLEGTFNPVDSIIISNKSGSIFADYPGSATIQPVAAFSSIACIEIDNSSRFSIVGVEVKQDQAKLANLGILGYNVQNLICYTCSVDEFDVVSGNTFGIYAVGSGRIENCHIYDINSYGQELYGVYADGLHIIDCEVYALSGTNTVKGISTSSQSLPRIIDYQLILL